MRTFADASSLGFPRGSPSSPAGCPSTRDTGSFWSFSCVTNTPPSDRGTALGWQEGLQASCRLLSSEMVVADVAADAQPPDLEGLAVIVVVRLRLAGLQALGTGPRT